MNGFRRALTLFAAFHLALASVAFGQSGEAALEVFARDPNGAAIEGARVTLVPATGPSREAATDRRGRARLARLAHVSYTVRVEANGFAPFERAAFVPDLGSNRLDVKLDVARVDEEVVVSRDKLESGTDPRGDAFTNVITGDQLDALPDDPDEFEEAVRRMAGPGAALRVNGFRGGRMPPKSQIREIRFRRNPYAAENHEAGLVTVDIITKPGFDSRHGSTSFAFRDEALGARNAFAPVRAPEQGRTFDFSLDGPLWKKRTSLFLAGRGVSSYDSSSVFAVGPDGPIDAVARRPVRQLDISARVEHAIDDTHTLRAEYQRNARLDEGLGVGGLSLAERAYSTDRVEHVARVSESGLFFKKFLNEFRFQTRWERLDTTSASDEPGVIVLGAFATGGAQNRASREVFELDLSDDVDFAFGNHAMRAGARVEHGRYRSDDRSDERGTYTFASLDDYRAGRPSTFRIATGDGSADVGLTRLGLYWQDDFRAHKSVSLSFGLRYEAQSGVDDRTGFLPRVGFTWAPFADGQTVVRGGFGVFGDWVGGEVFERADRFDGAGRIETVVRDPVFGDPFDGDAETLAPSRLFLDPALELPQTRQASIGVERRFGSFGALLISYLYQSGAHQLRGRNANAPDADGLRPDPLFGNVTRVESTASLASHALDVNYQLLAPGRRFSCFVGYRLSSAVDEVDSPFDVPASELDLAAERGPAAFDSRHRLFAMVNSSLVWGLRIGSFFAYESATPFDITTGEDDNGDALFRDRPTGVTRNTGRGAARAELSARLSWSVGFGDVPEPTGPRVSIVRLGGGSDPLAGPPALGSEKRWKLDFYVRGSNLLNRTNGTGFSGVAGSPLFGKPTGALAARRIETGVRFSF